MFTGTGAGHAASEEGGGRWALRLAVPLLLVVLGAGAWWYLRQRAVVPPTPVHLVEGPSSSRPTPAAPSPSPSETPAPKPAPTTPSPSPPARPPGKVPEGAPAVPAPAVAAPSPSPSPAPSAAAPRPSAPSAPTTAVGAGEHGPNFDTVRKITFQAAGGETEIVLWTNGVVRAEDVEHMRLDEPDPREVFKLRGVSEPFSPSKITVGTPEVRQIRVGFHEQRPRGQLHVVFDLASRDVHVVSMRADGGELKIRLGRE